MKRFFRFLHGNINGFFADALFSKLPNLWIEATGLLFDFLYFKNRAWFLKSEPSNKRYLTDEDMLGIMLFAGVPNVRAEQNTNIGSIRFAPTTKRVGDGHTITTRGLFDINFESFLFKYNCEKEFDEEFLKHEINEHLGVQTKDGETYNLYSTFVERGRKPLGYLKWGDKLFDEKGFPIWDNVLETPPADSKYENVYGVIQDGEKRLSFLSFERFKKDIFAIPTAALKTVYETIMKINEEGENIALFMNILSTFFKEDDGDVEKVVYDIDFSFDAEASERSYITVYYKFNGSSKIYNRERKYLMWKEIVKKWFPSIKLEEIIGG